jgi:hypothetical protein
MGRSRPEAGSRSPVSGRAEGGVRRTAVTAAPGRRQPRSLIHRVSAWIQDLRFRAGGAGAAFGPDPGSETEAEAGSEAGFEADVGWGLAGAGRAVGSAPCGGIGEPAVKVTGSAAR